MQGQAARFTRNRDEPPSKYILRSRSSEKDAHDPSRAHSPVSCFVSCRANGQHSAEPVYSGAAETIRLLGWRMETSRGPLKTVERLATAQTTSSGFSTNVSCRKISPASMGPAFWVRASRFTTCHRITGNRHGSTTRAAISTSWVTSKTAR